MFHRGICQVCGKETDVAELGSLFGLDVKFRYCEDCMESGAEPYAEMVTYIAQAGCEPEDLIADFTKIVEASAKAAGKSVNRFWKDVRRERRLSMEEEQ